jgi:hypothetical protein
MVKLELPGSDHGVPLDTYDWDSLVELLRTPNNNPDSIQLIADMLAEAAAPGGA